MNQKQMDFALDALRGTIADIKEYVNFLRNCQLKGNFLEKFDREYVFYLKRKYYDRLEYYNYCVSEYARMDLIS